MLCDLCGSAAKPLEVFPAANVCDDCGFVYVPKRRTPEEIADDWETIYLSGGYDPQWPGVQARLFYVSEWLDAKFGLEDAKVLDIGAGDGSFLGFCALMGADCAGIEPSAKNVEKWALSWASEIGPWETAKPTKRYDFCTINWTLENCGDPIGMLKFAAEHADVVSVATGSRILVPFKKPMKSYFGPNNPDLHAFRWSRKSLEFAMWRAGLTVIEENDYVERDEMILVGRKLPLTRRPETDDPEEVQAYFDLWQKLF